MHALKTRQGQDPQALGHYRLLEGSSLPVLKTDLRTNKDCFHWMSMHLFFKIYRLVVISQIQFCSVQSLSRVRLLATPWTAAHQASLSITNSQSLLKLMSIESVMPSNQLILCHPLLLLPSIFPSIGIFSNKSALHIRWPKYWSFNFNISPSNEYSGLISFRIDWFPIEREVGKSLWDAFVEGSHPNTCAIQVVYFLI